MVIVIRVPEILMAIVASAPENPMGTAASTPISPRGTLIDANLVTPDGTSLLYRENSLNNRNNNFLVAHGLTRPRPFADPGL